MAEQPFYHTRPNKFIDRSMFVGMIAHLRKYLPIDRYTYIGFGSYQFDDFKLIHNALDINNMISIESDQIIHNRALFNKPFGCIDVVNSDSTDFISRYEPNEQNVIVWLDFTDPSYLGNQFSDFSSMLSILNKNDIVKITVNANPGSMGERHNAPRPDLLQTMRFDKLHEAIGHYIPTDATPDDMTTRRYPHLLLRCLKKAALEALTERPPYQKKFPFPLASSIYADGQQMATLTVMILDDHNVEPHIKQSLSNCKYATFTWDNPTIICIPPLTIKEILYINGLLPSDNAKMEIKRLLPFIFPKESDDTMLESYLKLYKYYPNFHHVSL